MMGKENLDPNGQKQGDPKEALNIANLNFETGKSLNIIPDWISENQERDELISNTILDYIDYLLRFFVCLLEL